MVYDEALAERVRTIVEDIDGVDEKFMFGGVCFTVGGNMACGVNKDDLVVRVGKEAYEETVKLPHAKPMTFTGRALKSMVYVDPKGFASDADLRRWVMRGVDFCSSLPNKAKPATKGSTKGSKGKTSGKRKSAAVSKEQGKSSPTSKEQGKRTRRG
eukprot:CAMPEP_0175835062 /NCGR_PEP_ID=MMETSP0107_2-20121207/16389_1 /TAXON_ID=195067 ORGANISM="Goniomonas pacifica, Strain CCMP1869" /NCGR_SAMPLE_ID=MMETSP0107_2 /ASSEMBLY_ACC=CAM_ASM_000203 /LENGTH=155 /DNA_ID=CAMNT_0017148325 /DNA_START=1 /DNA_END=468 /DNA_ORIENTATION=-